MNKFNQIYFKIIKEHAENNENLIIVDVQPSYEKFIKFNISNMLEYVKQFNNILWLYNRSIIRI